jgi:hypothetical protein
LDGCASNYLEVISDSILDEISIYNTIGELVYFSKVEGDRQLVVTSFLARGMYVVMTRLQSGDTRKERIVLE